MDYENAIELKGVTKRFGEVIANDHVDFTLRKGEILSVLGENGSGKTTLMNMLSGIYFPDEGTISVNGQGREEQAAICRHIESCLGKWQQLDDNNA